MTDSIIALLGVTAEERAECSELLDECSGLTLEGIRRRPAQLRATQAGLQAQQLKLASTSCAGFVESARCVAAVRGTMLAVSQHLSVLEEVLPLLGELAATLTAEVQGGIAARQSNARLLEQLVPAVEARAPTAPPSPTARADLTRCSGLRRCSSGGS